MNAKPWLMLIVLLAVCLGSGGLGSWFTGRGLRHWYPLLRKPAGAPPASVFGPIWTVLYVLMAVSAWLIWREYGRGAR
ncbi:MAG TPA: TspO/MBR family protein, partial [Candidatus Binatia bacterium]|nr:TspO/MBR family protein [Candidatus Binatia bacterium]